MPRRGKYKPRKPHQPPKLSSKALTLTPAQRIDYRRARAEIQHTLLHLTPDASTEQILLQLQYLLDRMQIQHSIRALTGRQRHNPSVHAPDRLTRCLCSIAFRAVRKGQPATWTEADAEHAAKDHLLQKLGIRSKDEGGN